MFICSNQDFLLNVDLGHLHKLRQCEEYIIRQNWLDNYVFIRVVRAGHLSILRWIWDLKQNGQIEINPTFDNNLAFLSAVGCGHIEIVKWLWSLKQDFQLDIDLPEHRCFAFAARDGHLEVLKWLWGMRQYFQDKVDPTLCNNVAFVEAGRKNKKEVLKWLWSLNVCSNLKLYSQFMRSMSGDDGIYTFENIGKGWIFSLSKSSDNLIYRELMAHCKVTNAVLKILLMYLNRQKMYFGREMNEKIMKKILLCMLPKMINSRANDENSNFCKIK